MRARILIAVVLAAAAGLWQLGRPPELYFPHAEIAPVTVKVLAAKRALPAGARLGRGELIWIDWPQSTLPEGTFTEAAALFGPGGARVPVLRRPLRAGAPLRAGLLLEPVPAAPAETLASSTVPDHPSR